MTTETDEVGMVMIETEDERRPAYPGDRGMICLCAVTGAEVQWDTMGREDACQCSNCTRYLKPPEAAGGTPAPVTVPEGDDPWPVLRAMHKFMPGTDRGECEIIAGSYVTIGSKPVTPPVIGLTILIGAPERVAQPVFDCCTRVIEVVELAAWLKARGYEASACQWNRPNSFNMLRGPNPPRWQLITGKAVLPPLPNPAPSPDDIRHAATQQRWRLYSDDARALLSGRYPMPTKGR